MTRTTIISFERRGVTREAVCDSKRFTPVAKFTPTGVWQRVNWSALQRPICISLITNALCQVLQLGTITPNRPIVLGAIPRDPELPLLLLCTVYSDERIEARTNDPNPKNNTAPL
ncbi:hypothetical protein Zmor_024891 [Zophobas morio]|uniref:Uncharacterized protein n=1 Tax=Zophobas morio TaxID=2755281 RepID=A0AA38HQW3_9CUCU|nr:hypothetical protein Zmor_024891 [Zophobas morio]